MIEPVTIESADILEAAQYDVLGPAYFASRRMAEQIMVGVEPDAFQAVATKAADMVREQIYAYIEGHLLSDLEINIQGHVWHLVDDTVRALLSGDAWAMKRYPYASTIDGERIRATVATHGGDPLLLARIVDLEKENARLVESREWAR